MILDDELASQGYRQKLQAHGFKIELTSAFDTTLQFVKNGGVNLTIIDLCLPGINVVELIRAIRSDSSVQAARIIAFCSPYLGSLMQAAVEAGATKCVAKFDTTPEQLVELVRELGVSPKPNRTVANTAAAFESGQEKPSSNLLINKSQTLAKLRAGFQNFSRTEREDVRRTALLQMHRQLRSLIGSANVLALRNAVQMSIALEALLIELYNKPAKTTPSVVRTIAHSVETLASLFERTTNSQAETIASPKVLAVDDEVIARQLICSAVEKCGLEPVGLDDPLAAQRLVERERFGVIFLDIEMPGLTGLELGVKIRATESNRTTPIVFVTSHADFGSRAQSALSGGNDFIAKPFLLVEVALKALTWLCKDGVQPVAAAGVQHGITVATGRQESSVAAPRPAMPLPRSSPVR